MAEPIREASAEEQSGERVATTTPVELPRPAARYTAGTVLCDKYELERRLGEGGMAFVWRARNRVLQSNVAVKLLRPELKGLELLQRFQIEAQVEAQLSHPNIVHVFDYGQTEHGDPFIVMELLEGTSLADELGTRGPFDAVYAVRTLLPVLSALAFAHDAGIVHRDMKPENIFLARCSDGVTRPKIVDFGIAKRLARGNERPLTFHGALLGSPAYMAPEQARGLDDVDHRADIWSMAVVLYECLGGSQPFRASNYRAILRAVTEDEPAPLEGVDPMLRQIVTRGLNKLRAARYSTMDAFGAALARWLLGRGVTTDICGNSLRDIWGCAQALQSAQTRTSVPTEALAPTQPAALVMDSLARDSVVNDSVVNEPVLHELWFDVSVPVELQAVARSVPPPVRARRLGRKVAYAVAVVSMLFAAFAALDVWANGGELPTAHAATLTVPTTQTEAGFVRAPEPSADLAAEVQRGELLGEVAQTAPAAPEPEPTPAPALASASVPSAEPQAAELGLKDPY